jgi:ethanolamine utilization protein EutN
MKIARVTGTVTASVKEARLTGLKLLVTNVEDGAGAVLETAVVAVDTCGAGVGDLVMLVSGSAARLPAAVAGIPVDTAVIAVIDHVEFAAGAATKTPTRTGTARKPSTRSATKSSTRRRNG